MVGLELAGRPAVFPAIATGLSTTALKIWVGSEKAQNFKRSGSSAPPVTGNSGAIVADLRGGGIVPSGKRRNLQSIVGIRMRPAPAGQPSHAMRGPNVARLLVTAAVRIADPNP